MFLFWKVWPRWAKIASVVILLLCISVAWWQFKGRHWWNSSDMTGEMTPERQAEFNKLEADKIRLQTENKELEKQVSDLKTERAAQEAIIKQRGGQIAADEKKLEQAEEEFRREQEETGEVVDARTRCERLKSKYIKLGITSANAIDCAAIQ